MILIVDVGTSSVRSSVLDEDFAVVGTERATVSLSSPADGLFEFEPARLAEAALATARAVAGRADRIDAVGVADQRASTVVWDPRSGVPVGPGIGWQDLRTVGRCLELRGQGVRMAPNASGTKAEWLLDHAETGERSSLLVGTVDAWLLWHLTDGTVHATDHTNAGVTGLFAGEDWSEPALTALRITRSQLPRIVDSAGVVAEATALPGAPPVTALIGDQQASLVGQGCISPGATKITFGTGAMLDTVTDGDRVAGPPQDGCYPIVAWSQAGRLVAGTEAIMLGAGTTIEWLRDGLGLIDDVAETDGLAASVPDAAGVMFVPALAGLGTPHWDHGARGTLLGLTRGSTSAHVVRAVLEGIAQRGADLVEAAERAGGVGIESVRVDGGMSANETFVQLLADATQRPVEVASELESTTRGAAALAAVGAGLVPDLATATSGIRPARVVEPEGSLDRHRWIEAVDRARAWIPELSSLEF